MSSNKRKVILDTNIYIDIIKSGELEIFYQQRYLIYLPAIVLMELKAGAHSKEAIDTINDLRDYFKRKNRIIEPTRDDFDLAGEILAKLQSEKGYDLKKTYSLANDVLIALTARKIGAEVATQNKTDFEAIKEIKDFRLEITSTYIMA